MKNKFTLDLFDEKEKVASPENKPAEKDKADRKAEFEALIKGEYKDLYAAKIKDIISKRFRGNDVLKDKLSKFEGIIEVLSDRYGVSKDDLELLAKKVADDDALISDNAKEKGIDVENYRYIKSLEKENQYYKALEEKSKQQHKMQEQVKKWYDESEEIAKSYPDFDINAEIANAKFIELLRSGVDMKTAYEVVHHADIIEAIKNKSAMEAEKETTERLLSVAGRPVENGMSAQSPALVKTDVSKLTPEQRAQIAKRVSMGETITF